MRLRGDYLYSWATQMRFVEVRPWLKVFGCLGWHRADANADGTAAAVVAAVELSSVDLSICRRA